ncbi:MAG: hypothetical protein WDN48_18660 [Pseudolabrys sp.]
MLFAVLAVKSPEAARVFAALVETRHTGGGLSAAALAGIQADIAEAFRAAFMLIAVFSAIGFVLVLTNPLKRNLALSFAAGSP